MEEGKFFNYLNKVRVKKIIVKRIRINIKKERFVLFATLS